MNKFVINQKLKVKNNVSFHSGREGYFQSLSPSDIVVMSTVPYDEEVDCVDHITFFAVELDWIDTVNSFEEAFKEKFQTAQRVK